MRSVVTLLALGALVAVLQETSSISPEDEGEQSRLTLGTNGDQQLSNRYLDHQCSNPCYLALRNVYRCKQTPYCHYHPSYGGFVRTYPRCERGNQHISLCSKQGVSSSSGEYPVGNTDDPTQAYKTNSSPVEFVRGKETVLHPRNYYQAVEDNPEKSQHKSGNPSDLVGNGYTYDNDLGKRKGYEYASSDSLGYNQSGDSSGFHENTDEVLRNEQDVSLGDTGSIIRHLDDAHTSLVKEIPNTSDLSNINPSIESQYPGQGSDAQLSVSGSSSESSSDFPKLGWSLNTQQNSYPVLEQGYEKNIEAHGSFSSNPNDGVTYSSKYNDQTVPSQQSADYTTKEATLTDIKSTEQDIISYVKTKPAVSIPSIRINGHQTQNSGKPRKNYAHPLFNKQLTSKATYWPHNENLDLEREMGVSEGSATSQTYKNDQLDFQYGYSKGETNDAHTSDTSRFDNQYGYQTLENQEIKAQDQSSNSLPNQQSQGKNGDTPQGTTSHTTVEGTPVPNEYYPTQNGQVFNTDEGAGYPLTWQSGVDHTPQGLYGGQLSMSGQGNMGTGTQGKNLPTGYSTGYDVKAGDKPNGSTLQTTDKGTLLSNGYYPKQKGQVFNSDKGAGYQLNWHSGVDPTPQGFNGGQLSMSGEGNMATAVQEENLPTGYSTINYKQNNKHKVGGPISETGFPMTGKPGDLDSQTLVDSNLKAEDGYFPSAGYDYELNSKDRSEAKNVLNTPLRNIYGYNYERSSLLPAAPFISNGGQLSMGGQGNMATGTQDNNLPTGYSTVYDIKVGDKPNGSTLQTTDNGTPEPNGFYPTQNGQVFNTNEGAGQPLTWQSGVDRTPQGLYGGQLSMSEQGNMATGTQGKNLPTGYSTGYKVNSGDTPQGSTSHTTVEGASEPHGYFPTQNGQVFNTDEGARQPLTWQSGGDRTPQGLYGGQLSMSEQGNMATGTQGKILSTGYSTGYDVKVGDKPNGSTSHTTVGGALEPNGYFPTQNGQVFNTDEGARQPLTWQSGGDRTPQGLYGGQLSMSGQGNMATGTQGKILPTGYSTGYDVKVGDKPNGSTSHTTVGGASEPNGYFPTQNGQVFNTDEGAGQPLTWQSGGDRTPQGLYGGQLSMNGQGNMATGTQGKNLPTGYSTVYDVKDGDKRNGSTLQTTDKGTPEPNGYYATQNGQVFNTDEGAGQPLTWQSGGDRTPQGLYGGQLSMSGQGNMATGTQGKNLPTGYSTGYDVKVGDKPNGSTSHTTVEGAPEPNGYFPTQNGQVFNTDEGAGQPLTWQSGGDRTPQGLYGGQLSMSGQGNMATGTQGKILSTGYSTGYDVKVGDKPNGSTSHTTVGGALEPNGYFPTQNGQVFNTDEGARQPLTWQSGGDRTPQGLYGGQLSMSGQGNMATGTQGKILPTGYSTGYDVKVGDKPNGSTSHTTVGGASEPNGYFPTQNGQVFNTDEGAGQPLTWQSGGDRTPQGLYGGQLSMSGQGNMATGTQGKNLPTGYSTGYDIKVGDKPNGSTSHTTVEGTPEPNGYFPTQNGQVFNTDEGAGYPLTWQSGVDRTPQGLYGGQLSMSGQGNMATGTQGKNLPTGYSTITYKQNNEHKVGGPISETGYPMTGTPGDLVSQTYVDSNLKAEDGRFRSAGYVYELNSKDRSGAKNILNTPLRNIYGYNYERNSLLTANPFNSSPYENIFGEEGRQLITDGITSPGTKDGVEPNNYSTKLKYGQTSADSSSPANKLKNEDRKLENYAKTTGQSPTTSHDSNIELPTSERDRVREETSTGPYQNKDTSIGQTKSTITTDKKQDSTPLQGIPTDLTSDDDNDKVVSLGEYSMKLSQLKDIVNSFKTPEQCVLTVPHMISGPLPHYSHVMNSFPASVHAKDGIVQLPSGLIVPYHCYKHIASVYAPKSEMFADVSGTILPSGQYVETSTISKILASRKTPEKVMLVTPREHAVPNILYSKYIDKLSPEDKKILKVMIPGEKNLVDFGVYQDVLNNYGLESQVDDKSKKDKIKLLASNLEMTFDQLLSILNNQKNIKMATVTLPSHRSLPLPRFLQIADILGEEYTRQCIVNIANTDCHVPYTAWKHICRIYLGKEPLDLTKDTDVNYNTPSIVNPYAEYVDELEGGVGLGRCVHPQCGPCCPRGHYYIPGICTAIPSDKSDSTQSILDVLHPGHTELAGHRPRIRG